MFSLNGLEIGKVSVIEGVRPSGMEGRLEDLGFTAGAKVECLFAAPSGDPRAYLVRGAVIALRGEDAAEVAIFGGEE